MMTSLTRRSESPSLSTVTSRPGDDVAHPRPARVPRGTAPRRPARCRASASALRSARRSSASQSGKSVDHGADDPLVLAGLVCPAAIAMSRRGARASSAGPARRRARRRRRAPWPGRGSSGWRRPARIPERAPRRPPRRARARIGSAAATTSSIRLSSAFSLSRRSTSLGGIGSGGSEQRGQSHERGGVGRCPAPGARGWATGL